MSEEIKDNYFTIIKENGDEQLCKIIFTHYSEEFNANYVVFYLDEANDEISAMKYLPNESEAEGILDHIETDEEWDMIENLIEEFQSEEEEDDEDYEEEDYEE